MSRTALLVPVPEAEPLVHDLRIRHDPAARRGVPAHITLLFPFLPSESIHRGERDAILRIVDRVPPFSFELSGVGRFPATLFLEPRPPGPFVDLTEALAGAFPACPPYEGRFDRIVPHLTVADGSADVADALQREVQERLGAHGAVQAECSAVHLYLERGDHWECGERYPLGG